MTPKQRAPKPPKHLSRATRDWWRHVVESYELEPHHLRILQLACEAWDRATGARELLAKDGTVFRDRFGTPKKHPAVGIEEQARLAFARLVRELDLEGEVHPGYRRS
jgi:P27 family predicted phage terminase small subunit